MPIQQGQRKLHPAVTINIQDSQNPPMGHEGHDHHAMMTGDFKKRFFIVLLLTIPVLLLSEMIQHWLNIHFVFPGSRICIIGIIIRHLFIWRMAIFKRMGR